MELMPARITSLTLSIQVPGSSNSIGVLKTGATRVSEWTPDINGAWTSPSLDDFVLLSSHPLNPSKPEVHLNNI